MVYRSMMTLTVGVVFAAVFASPALAVAEVDLDIDTLPPDYEFGQYEPGEDARLDDPDGVRGRVDQRAGLNPLAGHTIGWTSGYIPPAGSVTVTNRMLFGQRIGIAPGDGIELFGEVFLPLGSQTYLGAGTEFHVAQGDAWNLTTGIQGRYRRTNFQPGTADAGAVVHAVLDAIATDDTTWNVGVAVHAPAYRLVEDVDFQQCDTRREWAESECGTTERRDQWLPNSGWWAAAFGGINHFVTDWLILNVEGFTGVSQGNFWALESALDPELAYETERRVVEETQWTPGLGPLGIFTLGLGGTWRLGGFAAQTSLYFTNYRGDARILPWLSAAYRW